MSRSGGKFQEELQYLVNLTGTITNKWQRGRMRAERALNALEACHSVSRHLAQGNFVRALAAAVSLLDVFGIHSKDEFEHLKNKGIRKFFELLTTDQRRLSIWETLPEETLTHLIAIGIDPRPMSMQMGATKRGIKNDSTATAFSDELDATANACPANLDGASGAHDMGAEPGEEPPNK